jgi:hypothetical protein
MAVTTGRTVNHDMNDIATRDGDVKMGLMGLGWLGNEGREEKRGVGKTH